MAKIMYNNVPYGGGGSGNANVVEVTKAEYDKLEASGDIKADTLYLIKDGYVGMDAGMGNTDISGIGDGTVTGAISALDSKIKFKEVSVTFDGGKASISEESITANSVVVAIRKVVDGQLSSVVLSTCARNGGAYLCAYTTADTSFTGTLNVYLMWTTA